MSGDSIEELSDRERFGRREALSAGAAGALALGLAACSLDRDEDGGDGGTTTDHSPGTELEQLAGIAAVERRATLTYDAGARFSATRQAREFETLSRQSTEHVAALERMITDAGGEQPAPAAAPGNTYIRDQASAVAAGKAVSARLVDMYLTAIPFQDSTGRRRELTTMLANDAEHLVMLGGLSAASALPGEGGEEIAEPEKKRRPEEKKPEQKRGQGPAKERKAKERGADGGG